MPVRVSVVVPVYNPGPYIEDCVASMLRQSLPPDEFEVIFVDDGSTDETPARLDAVAAEHPHIHVVHQESSGWAGKPRNVGIAAAQGEYVMFVDNDDYLGDEALERMYAYGVAHKADMVVGKMAGRGRSVPVELFRVNRPHATVENAPLFDSLTPYKMIRREFLERTGLRFPEGRRRLEDHVFAAEAFLRADTISVLSDYVCYYHVRRDDGSNSSFQRFDPVGYFKNLREALDVVERYTEPGPLRDRLYRRWLRVEIVDRMRGRGLLTKPADYRRELFDEMRGVVTERFGPGVAAGLPPAQRIVAELIRAGRYDDVVAYAEWESSVTPRAVPGTVGWHDGRVRIGFDTEYTAAKAAMTFPVGGERTPVEGAPGRLDEAVERLGADAEAAFGKARADLVLRERTTSASHFQKVDITRERVPAGMDGRVRLVLHCTADLDPATAAGGAPVHEGLWDLYVRLTVGGRTKECRLGPAPQPHRPEPPAGVIAGRVVLPYWTTSHADLSLDVDRAVKSLGLARLTPEDMTVTGGCLTAPLPLYVPRSTDVLLRLTGTASGRVVEVPGTLTPGVEGTGALLTTSALPLDELTAASWRTAVCLTPASQPARFLTLPPVLRVTRSGEVRALRPSSAGLTRRVVRRLRKLIGTTLGRTGPGSGTGRV
ncbi:glycosyltransferase family 2 protein [Streptomyces sp. YIM S03343]